MLKLTDYFTPSPPVRSVCYALDSEYNGNYDFHIPVSQTP